MQPKSSPHRGWKAWNQGLNPDLTDLKVIIVTWHPKLPLLLDSGLQYQDLSPDFHIPK